MTSLSLEDLLDVLPDLIADAQRITDTRMPVGAVTKATGTIVNVGTSSADVQLDADDPGVFSTVQLATAVNAGDRVVVLFSESGGAVAIGSGSANTSSPSGGPFLPTAGGTMTGDVTFNPGTYSGTGFPHGNLNATTTTLSATYTQTGDPTDLGGTRLLVENNITWNYATPIPYTPVQVAPIGTAGFPSGISFPQAMVEVHGTFVSSVNQSILFGNLPAFQATGIYTNDPSGAFKILAPMSYVSAPISIADSQITGYPSINPTSFSRPGEGVNWTVGFEHVPRWLTINNGIFDGARNAGFTSGGYVGIGARLDMTWGYLYQEGVAVTGHSTQTTTVSGGSSGVDVSTFAGAGVLHVVSTTNTGADGSGGIGNFASSGTLTVGTVSSGVFLMATIAYTGTTSTSFTGCTLLNGSGNLFPGGEVSDAGIVKTQVGAVIGNLQEDGSTLMPLARAANNYAMWIAGQIAAYPSDITMVQNPNPFISMAGTYTLDFPSTSISGLARFTGTVILKQSASVNGMGTLFADQGTYKNDAATSGITFTSRYAFVAQPTFVADSQSVSQLLQVAFWSQPTYSTTGGGTIANTTLYQYRGQLVVDTTGATIGTRAVFRVEDITLSSSAAASQITTQVGLDIPVLANAATNIGIRNASPLVQSGAATFTGTVDLTGATVSGLSGWTLATSTPSVNVISGGGGAVGARFYGGQVILSLARSNGLTSGGTPIISGDVLAEIRYTGSTTTSATPTMFSGAVISAQATETYSTTAGGTKLIFATTQDTTHSLTTALTLGSNQSATFAGAIIGSTTLAMTGATTLTDLTVTPTTSGGLAPWTTYGIAGVPIIRGFRINSGTNPVTVGQTVATFAGGGQYDTTAGHTAAAAQIQIIATESWAAGTPNSLGSKIVLLTVPNTTATPTAALTLNQDQSALFAGAVSGVTTFAATGTASFGASAQLSIDGTTGNLSTSANLTTTGSGTLTVAGTSTLAAATLSGQLTVLVNSLPTQLFRRGATTITSGQGLGQVLFSATYNSGTNYVTGALIGSNATQTWSGTGVVGANLIFQTLPNGGGSLTTALTLGQDQGATFAGLLTPSGGIGGAVTFNNAVSGITTLSMAGAISGATNIIDLSTAPSNTVGVITATSGIFGARYYGNGVNFRLERVDGTAGVPSVIQNTDILANFLFAGASAVSGTTATIYAGANIVATATETWTSSLGGTSLALQTTANGTHVKTTALLLGQDQSATLAGTLIGTPSTVQALIAGTAISPNALIVHISSTATITLSATPTITAGTDGQVLVIINDNTTAARTITFQSNDTLAGSNLSLNATTLAIGPRGSLTLVYSSTLTRWVQVGANTAGH